MKQYVLTFQSLSTITSVPDAQKIFGAICNIIKNTQGDEALQKYFKSFDSEPMLVHSSMYPLNMLPMINQNLFSLEYVNNTLLNLPVDQQLSYLQEMKVYKKLSYMSEDIYVKYIQSSKLSRLKLDLLNNKNLKISNGFLYINESSNKMDMIQQLNTRVKKQGFYATSDEDKQTDMFYDRNLYCKQNARFVIYVKTILSKKELESIFKYTHFFGIGERHSVGKNSFKLLSINECNLKSADGSILLLSKSTFDSKFCLDESYYTIYSKMHRTSYNYLNHTLIGRYNLLSEGSYMKVNESKEWYGSLIKNVVGDKTIYYYAVGYTF